MSDSATKRRGPQATPDLQGLSSPPLIRFRTRSHITPSTTNITRTKQRPTLTFKKKAPAAATVPGRKLPPKLSTKCELQTTDTPARPARSCNEKVDNDEVAALQAALKEADERLRQAQETRDNIAAKLQALGQVAIVTPWTQDHLEGVYESSCNDFREMYGEVEDFESEADAEAKLWAIKLLKMHVAIQGEQASEDARRDPGRVSFRWDWLHRWRRPMCRLRSEDEDLEEFDWEDADLLW